MPVLSQFLEKLSTVQFLILAGNTLLTYDYFLTLDLEVDYIWHAPRGLVKIIFLLNRYGTLAGQSVLTLQQLGLLSHGSREFCVRFQWFLAVFVLISSETIRVLLLLRAWSLWRCSFRMAISLVMLYTIYMLALGGYTSYILLKYGAYFYFPYLDKTRVCVVLSDSPDAWIIGLISFSLDTLTFALITYCLYKLYRGPRELEYSPLLRLVIRDTIIFYLVNVIYDAVGVFSLYFLRGTPLYSIQVAFFYPLLIVAGQRTILNLRAYKPGTYATRDISHTIDRQIAAMQHRSFWRSVDLWMDDLHQALGEGEPGERSTRSRTTSTRSRTTTTGEGNAAHELQILYSPRSKTPALAPTTTDGHALLHT